MYAKVLLTTHCARLSLIGPLELADMMTHISQSVSVLNITPYGNIHKTINLYANILINKYQGLITCNRITPLQFSLGDTCFSTQCIILFVAFTTKTKYFNYRLVSANVRFLYL